MQFISKNWLIKYNLIFLLYFVNESYNLYLYLHYSDELDDSSRVFMMLEFNYNEAYETVHFTPIIL